MAGGVSKEELKRPIREFRVNTSHNTYIDCWQNLGCSNEGMYTMALNMGARAIEIDVSKGRTIFCHDSLVVTHNPCCRTTSAVPLTVVLDSIAEHEALHPDKDGNAPDPLWINIELAPEVGNESDVKYMDMLYSELEKRWGDSLYRPEKDGHNVGAYPLEKLCGKIIIVGSDPSGVPESHPYRRLLIKYDEVCYSTMVKEAGPVKVPVVPWEELSPEFKAKLDPSTPENYYEQVDAAWFWNKGENPAKAKDETEFPPWDLSWRQSVRQSMLRLFPGELFKRNFSVNVSVDDYITYREAGIQQIALNFSFAGSTLAENQRDFGKSSYVHRPEPEVDGAPAPKSAVTPGDVEVKSGDVEAKSGAPGDKPTDAVVGASSTSITKVTPIFADGEPGDGDAVIEVSPVAESK